MEQVPNGVFTFTKKDDLVSCGDPMFRPVAITFGPDGCLYITDWYNRIISHNEVARDHPARDRTRGSIWRVRHKSQATRVIPDMTKIPAVELPAHLAADNTWEMRAAWQEIAARGGKELVSAITAMIRKPEEITLMFMGGTTHVIPAANVKNAGYVQGKSSMPPLGAGLSDQQVADVVRYLRTVK